LEHHFVAEDLPGSIDCAPKEPMMMQPTARFSFLFCLTALAIVLGCTSARPPPTDSSSTEPSQQTATPPFFRIQGVSGPTLFLMGTIHLGPVEGWNLSPEINQAIEQADSFVLELDPRNVTEDDVATVLAERVVLPIGVTIDEVLSPETAKLLDENDELLTSFGQPALARRRLKPWYLAIGLIERVTAVSGYPVSESADALILEALGNRPLEGLETFADQLAMLDELPAPLQDLMLHDAVSRIGETLSEIERLMQAWATNDESTLIEIAYQGTEECPELADFYQILLVDRNRQWAIRLGELMNDPRLSGQSIFVGVGALHLVGENNLPQLLKTTGYDVHPIEQSNIRTQ
jgi:uncharacterized protein YbaP (TraB family)